MPQVLAMDSSLASSVTLDTHLTSVSLICDMTVRKHDRYCPSTTKIPVLLKSSFFYLFIFIFASINKHRRETPQAYIRCLVEKGMRLCVSF